MPLETQRPGQDREQARKDLYERTSFDGSTQKFVDKAGSVGGVIPADNQRTKELRSQVNRGRYPNVPSESDTEGILHQKKGGVVQDVGVLDRASTGYNSRATTDFLNREDAKHEKEVDAVELWKKSLTDTREQLQELLGTLDGLLYSSRMKGPIEALINDVRKELKYLDIGIDENAPAQQQMDFENRVRVLIDEARTRLIPYVGRLRGEIASNNAQTLTGEVDELAQVSTHVYDEAVNFLPEVYRGKRTLEHLQANPNPDAQFIQSLVRDLQTGIGVAQAHLDAFPDQARRADLVAINGFLERAQEQLRLLNERRNPATATLENLSVEVVNGWGPKDLHKFVDIFCNSRKPIDPWHPDLSGFSDKEKTVVRALVDGYMFVGSATDPEQEWREGRMKESEAIEFYRQRTRMWAYREANFDGDLTKKQNIPGGNSDIVLDKMTEKGLTRVDILAGVTEHPQYGEASRMMMRYAIDVMSRRTKDERGRGGKILRKADHFPPGFPKDLDYATLAGKPGALNLFKQHLHDVFVGDPNQANTIVFRDDTGVDAMIDKKGQYKEVKRTFNRIPEDQFDIVWNLYYSFDLASISHALRQKDSQTKFHNGDMKIDYTILSYPWHFIAHKIGRYGFDNAYGNLLIFANKYPDDWINSGTDTNLRPNNKLSKHKYMQLLMEKLLLNMKAYMPTKYLRKDENTMIVSDASVFPDFYDFLTKRLSGEDKSARFGREESKIPSLEEFRNAQNQFREMLSKTVGALPDNPFATGGYLPSLVSSGVGIAKTISRNEPVKYEELGGKAKEVVLDGEKKFRKGDHTDLLMPMIHYAIGLGAAQYQEDGHAADRPDQRIELAHELTETLEIGSQGGLKGLGIVDIIHELETPAHETENLPRIYQNVPDLVLPVTTRTYARSHYMKMRQIWKHPPSVEKKLFGRKFIFPPKMIFGRMIPYVAGEPAELHEMSEIIQNSATRKLPNVFDRAQTDTKTTDKPKAA